MVVVTTMIKVMTMMNVMLVKEEVLMIVIKGR